MKEYENEITHESNNENDSSSHEDSELEELFGLESDSDSDTEWENMSIEELSESENDDESDDNEDGNQDNENDGKAKVKKVTSILQQQRKGRKEGINRSRKKTKEMNILVNNIDTNLKKIEIITIIEEGN